MRDYSDPSLIRAIEAASKAHGEHLPEVKAAVLHEVFFNSEPSWLGPFALTLALSVGIATLGLSQDSAATIIGAMIIAPLGSPIVAFGGAVALGWPRQVLQLLAIIGAGAALAVLLAYGIGFLMPEEPPGAQLLARTTPDLRDLGVAVFAGAAGGYGRTRPELSSTLIGVAIAVALVPPLAAAGLLLQSHHAQLAQGALLLFATNLVGISVAVAVVMLLTGYAPRPHWPRSWKTAALALVGVLFAATVVVQVSHSYFRIVEEARRVRVAREVAAPEVRSAGGLVRRVSLNEHEIQLDIEVPGGYMNTQQLVRSVKGALGPDTQVTITTGSAVRR